MIVVAGRADRHAARAVAERAGDPQQALPQAEDVAVADYPLAALGVGFEIVQHEGGRDAVAELLGRLGAVALVQAVMQNGVGRAGMQAARAAFSDADLFGHRPVGLQLQLGQDAGEIDPRAVFRRQDVDVQTERAHAGLDAEMTGRQPPVAAVLHAEVGFLPHGDEARPAVLLQPAGEAVADLVEPAQDRLVHILDGDRQLGPEHGDRSGERYDDHAAAIGGDTLRRLGPARVGRKGVERIGRGDADQVGAEIARHLLDFGGVEGGACHGGLTPPRAACSAGSCRSWSSAVRPRSRSSAGICNGPAGRGHGCAARRPCRPPQRRPSG